MTEPNENTPLSSDELSRLDTLSLAWIAAGHNPECEECGLEPGLVVRLVAQTKNQLQRIEDQRYR